MPSHCDRVSLRVKPNKLESRCNDKLYSVDIGRCRCLFARQEGFHRAAICHAGGAEEDGARGKRCQRRKMIWWAVEKAGELGKNARKLSDRTISIKLILSLQLDFTSVCKQVCQSNQHQKFFISYDPPIFMNTPSRSDATPWINILSAHYYPHHHSVLFTNCGRQHAFYSNNSYL